MKRMLATVFGALMLLATFGVATASAGHQEKDGPGPNGHNDKGLCTAYFNGQKKGHDKQAEDGQSPGPFGALEDGSGAEEDATRDEIASAVFEWCRTMAGDGSGVEIGGQPDANGRWTCTQEDENDPPTPDDSSDDTFECTDNPDKGKANA